MILPREACQGRLSTIAPVSWSPMSAAPRPGNACPDFGQSDQFVTKLGRGMDLAVFFAHSAIADA
jgi:hypothetical protein